MILEVKDLEFRYSSGRTIFEHVSFSLDKGRVFTILGRNGAGKSTLLNCLANLFVPNGGDILLNGVSMRSMKQKDVAKVIGYVPQVHIAAYAYTVRDFAVMGRTPYIGLVSNPRREDYEKVDEVLNELNIYHLRNKSYTEISGGERQLVTIARVMVQEPELILLDEPTAHLDYGNQLRAVRLIKRLAQRGFGVIVTTHDPNHAILLQDTVAILDRAGHLTTGRTEEMMTADRLSELYDIKLYLEYIERVRREVCVAEDI